MAIFSPITRLALGLCAVTVPCGLASQARAQTAAPPGDFTLAATIGGVSDYRFRGISLSGEEPALQGSLEAAHSSGFYAGAWASTLGDAGPADVEVDLYGGWTGDVGAATLDAGVLGYVYPDGSDLDYIEIYGSAGWTLGPATATLGAHYAPDQKNVGDDDNLYLYGNLAAGIPTTPVTLRAHLGYEDGGFGGPDGDKLDWSLGAEYVLGPVVLGAAYVDTDVGRIDAADATVVFSLTASF
jgi:uncharacterized protein (TIGR02001 family)